MGESAISFSVLDTKLACLASRDNQERLLQWNLNESLLVQKFRFSGAFEHGISSEYERLLSDFFNRADCCAAVGITGSPDVPTTMKIEQFNKSIMSMDFFDRLMDSALMTTSGNIRGCFDEQFDGITVGDKLREFLLNEDSEHASLYSQDEKKQLIFAIFKIFAVGGAMCQPDPNIQRYFEMTKAFYKDLITVYRDSKTEQVQVSGRVFRIDSVPGLELFNYPESSHNYLFAIIDPLKKEISIVKNSFKPYW